MQISESASMLPPYNKNSPAASIAPFRSSLNKNPSYFSLARSPDVLLLEKKKLKDENWKLKQSLHSLTELNLKLKQKLSQKSEASRIAISEGLHSHSQTRYIDVLQDSLRNLRSELNKRKQENVELRKRLSSCKDDKTQDIHQLLSSRSSVNSTDKNNDPEKNSPEKAAGELSKTVLFLESEIKNMQEENSLLESAHEESKATIQQLEGLASRKSILTVNTLEAVSIARQNKTELFSVSHDFNQMSSLRGDSDRLLKREAVHTEETFLLRFFSKLFSKLTSTKMQFTSLTDFIPSLAEDITLELFSKLLSHFQLNLPYNEIEESYMLLSGGSPLKNQELINILHYYFNELDSGKSSDISSGISIRSPKIKITIQKHEDEGMQTIFDNISLMLHHKKISKKDLESLCDQLLPAVINLQILAKFFFEHASFISDMSDKSFVANFFMEGFETKQKAEIADKISKHFCKFEGKSEIDSDKILDVLKRIAEKKEAVMEKFRELDQEKNKELSWDLVFGVLKENDCVNEEEAENLKIFCFELGCNLKKIPFEKLVQECDKIDQGNGEFPVIKAFIRNKATSTSN